MSANDHTIASPTHDPRELCPACGHPPHHFPKGIEIDGVTVYWTCANCNEAARQERERRARR